MVDSAKFEKMFDSLRSIKMPESTPPTILEVAGIANKETAISRILGFFLDSNEDHGMGNLWMESLLTCAAPDKADQCSSVSVSLEVGTDSQKRIDILASCDGFNVAIENKIDAGLNNPLGSYKKEATVGGTDAVLVVLSKWEIEACPEAESVSGDDRIWKVIPRDWAHVTYKQLFRSVQDKMNLRSDNCDGKWFVFAKDFITTIEDATESPIDEEAEERFFLENIDNIGKLLTLVSNRQERMIHKMSDLREQILSDNNSNDGKTITVAGREVVLYDWHCKVPAVIKFDQLHVCFGAICHPDKTDNRIRSKSVVKVEAWQDGKGWHISAFTADNRGVEENSLLYIKALIPEKQQEDTQFGVPCRKTQLELIPMAEASNNKVMEQFLYWVEQVCNALSRSNC